MFNLLVSADPDSWSGDPWTVDADRCVQEYTDVDIKAKFGALDMVTLAELKLLPTIFAYESSNRKNPHFGVIKDITKRQGLVRVEYALQQVSPFLSWEDMNALSFELDIGRWEMNRTHWAVKNVNLQQELSRARSIVLPSWVIGARNGVDLATHIFDVALSFPGEVRSYVEQVAAALEHLIGPSLLLRQQLRRSAGETVARCLSSSHLS